MDKFKQLIINNLKAELNMAATAPQTEEVSKRIDYLVAEMKKLKDG